MKNRNYLKRKLDKELNLLNPSNNKYCIKRRSFKKNMKLKKYISNK